MYMLRGSLISFGIAVVRFLAVKYNFLNGYQVRFFKSVNGEVNGKAFRKVRERAFPACLLFLIPNRKAHMSGNSTP